ncbi:hypothetical protein H0H93_006943 [Arthromyces matolae]|nr:hypothetical protein H0H93_006943 [Arthromyces matolae]
MGRPGSIPSNASTSMHQRSVVRRGQVRMKGQRPFSGWAWKPKSLVLTDDALFITGNSIPLNHITKVERVDLKPYCLLIQVKNRTYHLSFDNDGELYDWQDDVYSRTPLGGSKPFDFAHNIHVGFDEISNTQPAQWQALVDGSMLAPPNSADSEKTEIGTEHISPSALPSLAYKSHTNKGARPRSAILDGQLSIKIDGFFTGWRWVARWIVLRNKTLTIYRSQGAPGGLVINLADIKKVEVVNTRRLRIFTKSGKRYSMSFKLAEDAHRWRDAIAPRIIVTTKGGSISHPWGFVHHQHVGFDSETGAFTGIPESWNRLLSKPSSPEAKQPVSKSSQ